MQIAQGASWNVTPGSGGEHHAPTTQADHSAATAGWWILPAAVFGLASWVEIARVLVHAL